MKLLSRPSTALLALALSHLSAVQAQTLASPAKFIASSATSQGSAQSEPAGFGPLDPAPPSNGMTPAQIVAKMGEREAEFAHARQAYTFRQSVKVQTISDDNGRPDGEYQQVTDIVFNKDNVREERVVFAPANTLERVMMSPADFQDIEHRLPFVLTTDDLPQYDVTYAGRQKVDELDTYVFDAKPKVLEKGKRYFQGKVWLDQQDLQIVLVNGKSVPDDKRKGHEDLSPPYTTYYEQVDGKYWFPTYTKAEGELHFEGGNGYMSQSVQLRTIVKYTDYRRFRATSRIIYNGEDITDQQQPATTPPPAGQAPAQTTPQTTPPQPKK